ncbi:hypothetical protein MMC10_009455 [Thelotrema lepadinum]|nr:hypothetical protein [Thelotrema lepadinum]
MAANKHPSWAPIWLFDDSQLSQDEFSTRFNKEIYGWLYGEIERTNKTYMADQFRTEDAMVRQLKAWRLRVPERLGLAADRVVGAWVRAEPLALGNGVRSRTGPPNMQDPGRNLRMGAPPPPHRQQSEDVQRVTGLRPAPPTIEESEQDLRAKASAPPGRQESQEVARTVGPRIDSHSTQGQEGVPRMTHSPPQHSRQQGKQLGQVAGSWTDPPNIQYPQRRLGNFTPSPYLTREQNERHERVARSHGGPPSTQPQQHGTVNFHPPYVGGLQSGNTQPPARSESPFLDASLEQGGNAQHDIQQEASLSPEQQQEGRKRLSYIGYTSGRKYKLKTQVKAAEMKRLLEEAKTDPEAGEAYDYARRARKQWVDDAAKRRDLGQPSLNIKHPFKTNIKRGEKQILESQAKEGNRQAAEHLAYVRSYRSGRKKNLRISLSAGSTADMQPVIQRPAQSIEEKEKSGVLGSLRGGNIDYSVPSEPRGGPSSIQTPERNLRTSSTSPYPGQQQSEIPEPGVDGNLGGYRTPQPRAKTYTSGGKYVLGQLTGQPLKDMQQKALVDQEALAAMNHHYDLKRQYKDNTNRRKAAGEPLPRARLPFLSSRANKAEIQRVRARAQQGDPRAQRELAFIEEHHEKEKKKATERKRASRLNAREMQNVNQGLTQMNVGTQNPQESAEGGKARIPGEGQNWFMRILTPAKIKARQSPISVGSSPYSQSPSPARFQSPPGASMAGASSSGSCRGSPPFTSHRPGAGARK